MLPERIIRVKSCEHCPLIKEFESGATYCSHPLVEGMHVYENGEIHVNCPLDKI